MRWLDTQGHRDGVLKILKKIAVINKKPVIDLRIDTRPEVIYKIVYYDIIITIFLFFFFSILHLLSFRFFLSLVILLSSPQWCLFLFQTISHPKEIYYVRSFSNAHWIPSCGKIMLTII